jgi:phage/plasmid-associated DNA primase
MVIRPMYGEQREFMPEFKFLMICNSLPTFDGSDYAMKRRIRVIPFESTFVDSEEQPDPSKKRYLKDKRLGQRLEQWKYAVMGILLKAYQLYQEEGLSEVPEVMKKYTESYVKENDVLKQYVEENLESGDGRDIEFKTLTSDIFKDYRTFCGSIQVKASITTEKLLRERLVKEFGDKVQYKESKCTEKWGRKTQRFLEGVKLTRESEDMLECE